MATAQLHSVHLSSNPVVSDISLKKVWFLQFGEVGYPVKESKQGGDIDGKDFCGGAGGKVIQMQILQDPLGSCWRSCLSSTF